jgi:hypothetical protein
MNRIERERRTIGCMIRLYCKCRHGASGGLCGACEELLEYGCQRLLKCRYGHDKPTCANCSTHCYKPEMREGIRNVMRFSGPRMILRHPILAWMHIVDGIMTR